jgi:hypothetical protein
LVDEEPQAVKPMATARLTAAPKISFLVLARLLRMTIPSGNRGSHTSVADGYVTSTRMVYPKPVRHPKALSNGHFAGTILGLMTETVAASGRGVAASSSRVCTCDR